MKFVNTVDEKCIIIHKKTEIFYNLLYKFILEITYILYYDSFHYEYDKDINLNIL